MANELNPKVLSLSLASASGVLSLLCAALLAIAPDASLKFFGSIFHGIDVTKISVSVTLSGVIMGLIAVVVVAFVSGWIFAVAYNYFLNKIK